MPRGVYGKDRERHRATAPAAVGASIWQTPGGVVSEIKRIDDDMRLFSSELTQAVNQRGYHTADPLNASPLENQAADVARASSGRPDPTDPVVDFFKGTWRQFAINWSKFFEDNKSWGDNFWWNHAPEAEQYLDQLIAMRQQLGKLLTLQSPAPAQFGKSLLFDPTHNIVDAGRDKADELWQLLRYGVYGVLGIAGILAVTSIVQQVRKGNDPLESYTSLARGHGRLPPAVALATKGRR